MSDRLRSRSFKPTGVGVLAVVVFALVLAVSPSSAGMLGMGRIDIDFTDSTQARSRATWSSAEGLTVTAAGLGWAGDENSGRDGWIETLPFALGWSWRPTYGFSVRAAIQPAPRQAFKSSGRDTIYCTGELFVRYSPDLVHWSSWQRLSAADPRNKDEREPPGCVYAGEVLVPQVERQAYNELLLKYEQMDVPWKSDEDAAVRWIVGKDPTFFSKHLPFTGYGQLRLEARFSGGERVRRLRADIGYSAGGLSTKPKSGVWPPETEWRFKAKPGKVISLFPPGPASLKRP